ncbi:MAG TPA: magnesium/cobalt transporter CorA [Gammaproteobacteria bacterium]|jgi:magnesium transporter|nr:magnesium/cobalt transporter CorA [Gammaproteobacteria bacterium]
MLINCAAYQEGKKLTDIPQSEIGAYLRRPDCFVWVALRDADAAEMAEMQQQFGLHELAVEDTLAGSQRPKLEEYGDSLFTVLQTIEMVEGDLHVGELYIFVGPNYVLSCRRKSEKGFMDVRARCEREPHLLRHGSGYVLYALMDAAVDRYFPMLERLEGELDVLEERIFSKDASARANIESLYGLKQRLGIVKHATGPELEVVSKLFGGRVPMVCSNMGDYFRDIYDHLVRLNQSIDTARDTIGTAISVNLSMIALQENETTKKLASYAALIAVPTLVVGVYGMNFEHMPELHWTFGYPLALALMAGIDFYLYYRFRKSGWL